MTAGRRVVIVGASSGLGRTIGQGLAASGARVGFLARRKDRLDSAVAEAGNGAVAVQCDVMDEVSCREAIGEAARLLGGIDAVVYSTGQMTIAPLHEVDADTWSRLFATNVTGAALTTAAALPHLVSTRGVVVYLSSVSASLTAPWPNIGAYVTTKAALDKLVDAWRAEQPSVRFTRLSVGDCAGGAGHSGSEFISGVDPVVATDAINDWLGLGLMTGNLIDPADLVDLVGAIITNRAEIPSVTLSSFESPIRYTQKAINP